MDKVWIHYQMLDYVEDNLIWTIMKIIIFFHLLILLSWKLHHKGAL